MSSVFDLSLNPIEEIIYAHESKSFTFNCGLLFDFDVLLDQEKLKKSILLLMERFPILSTCISFGAGSQRTKLSNININDLLVVTSTENFNEEDFTDKFNLYEQLGFVFKLNHYNGKSSLKFYIHHSLVDGVAQAEIVKELFFIYVHGKPSQIDYLRPSLSSHKMSKFNLIKYLFSSKFRAQLNESKSDVEFLNIGRLEGPTPQKYGVAHINIAKADYTNLNRILKDYKCSAFTYILSSICKSMSQTESLAKDISIVFPVNLRPFLKLKQYIGNLVFLKRMNVPHGLHKDKALTPFLKKSLKMTLRKKELAQSVDFIFNLSSILSLKKLKKIFNKKTNEVSSFSSSFMVSYLKMPKDTFPEELKPRRILLLSAIFKSPGLGAVVLEHPDRYEITISYCRPEVSQEKINTFMDHLKNNLQLNQVG